METESSPEAVSEAPGVNITLPAGIKITKVKSTPTKEFVKKSIKTTRKASVYVPVKTTSYICVICGEYFPSFEALDSHMKHPCRSELATCSICQKSFKNKSRLKAHSTTHNEKEKYPCVKCGKELSNTIALQAHMEMMHTEYFDASKDGFICKFCPTTMLTKQQILKHINQKHLHVSTYLCDVCGKCFRQECGLRAHTSTHCDDKPFICEVCSKSFKMQSTLRAHLQTHSTEKRFVCDECGKAFKKKSTLFEHKRHHSSDFNF